MMIKFVCYSYQHYTNNMQDFDLIYNYYELSLHTYILVKALLVKHLVSFQLQSLLKNHDESKRINQLKDSVKKRYGIRPVEVTMSFYGADGKLVGTIKG